MALKLTTEDGAPEQPGVAKTDAAPIIETPTEDIDVALDEGEVGDTETQAETEEAKPAEPAPEKRAATTLPESGEEEEDEGPGIELEPKKKKPFNKTAEGRVLDALRRQREAERERDQEREARQRAEAARLALQHSAVVQFQRAVQNEIKLTQSDLQEAINNADPKAQAEIQTKLGALSAQLYEAEGWLRNNPEPKQEAPQKQPEPTREQRQQQAQAIDPRVEAWVARNGWFDPQADNFEPDMQEVAISFAQRLERRLASEGRSDLRNSRWYFRQVEDHMKRVFPDYFSAEGEDGPGRGQQPAPARGNGDKLPMRRPAQTVAPAKRAVPGQPAPNNRVVRLTAEERQVAWSLDLGTKPDGTPYTNADKERAYARSKAQQNRQGAG